jgi:hypothetical protein
MAVDSELSMGDMVKLSEADFVRLVVFPLRIISRTTVENVVSGPGAPRLKDSAAD